MTGKVDFFIVGAMKSGTSSLRDMLRQHPDVDMPRSEVHYFSDPELYEKGPDWYHGHFDFSREGVLHGEKGPPSGVDPLVPGKMAEYNPEAKLVWILRHPVRRLVSHFRHTMRRNRQRGSIEESLENAEALAAENSPYAWLYRSQYDRHIENFLKHYPRERHYVIVLEEFLAYPGTGFAGLARWLGIDTLQQPELPHSNATAGHIKRRFPVDPALMGRLQDLLVPTVDYVEDFLGRKIPAWHRL